MTPRVAIVDFGMGNLYSVRLACARAGLDARITSSALDVEAADAVILPGVGAFADAMAALRASGMVEALRRVVSAGKPLFGICLGFQLLMTESLEFGRHEGLGLVEGRVVYLVHPRDESGPLKVPHVGWNRIVRRREWTGTLLDGVPDGAFMYFVHSLHVQPSDSASVLSTTRYGDVELCSSFRRGNLFACQFHPERSGPTGLLVYRNLAALLVTAHA